MHTHTDRCMQRGHIVRLHTCKHTHTEARRRSGVATLVIVERSDSHLNEITREGRRLSATHLLLLLYTARRRCRPQTEQDHSSENGWRLKRRDKKKKLRERGRALQCLRREWKGWNNKKGWRIQRRNQLPGKDVGVVHVSKPGKHCMSTCLNKKKVI